MKHRYALQRNSGLTETKLIALYSLTNESVAISYFNIGDNIPKDMIPVGSIDFMGSIIDLPKPDYYPEFMKPYLHRRVWETDEWPMVKDIFIKPSDTPKRFDGKLTHGTHSGKKKPPFWCSYKVVFVDEWRIYVSDGKVLCNHWYDGVDVDREMPEFDESIIPEGWCGSIDMGILQTGEFALVECHHPYSVGWYGGFSTGKVFEEFSRKGWEYMKEIVNGEEV